MTNKGYPRFLKNGKKKKRTCITGLKRISKPVSVFTLKSWREVPKVINGLGLQSYHF